jgi:hypothetical protein
MRAVITGTDYIKDIDGSFKAIETNTNVGLSVDVSRYIDMNMFTQFVSDNGFEEIVMIYNDANLQLFNGSLELEQPTVKTTTVFSPDGTEQKEIERTINFNSLLNLLIEHYRGSSVNVTYQKVDKNSITVPDIDDSENKLIIRISFDATALIDDTYARDNWEFLKLMNDTDSTSIPKTYINDTELGFDSIGNVLRDNGNQPNYCIKKRITPADNNIYPKLLKVTSLEQLDSIKAGLEVDEYIQEFIFNPSDLLNNKIKIYRSVDMVYGGELDVLNLWVMEHTAIVDMIETPDYDDNNEIQIWDRNRYSTKFNSKTSDVAIKLSADENTKILDNNNQIVQVQNLNVGDLVKSVDIPGMHQNTDTVHTVNWTGSIDSILLDASVTQSVIVSKTETNYFGEIVEFELENGSVFSDVIHAKILVETDLSGSNVAVFKQYYELNVGNTILVWDNLTNTIIKNDIVDIRYSYQKLKAYTLNVEEFDLFLTLEEGEGNRYGLLTHNYDYDCRNHECYFGSFIPAGFKYCGPGFETNPCATTQGCFRVYMVYNGINPNCFNSDFSFYYLLPICSIGNQGQQQGYCNGQKS